MSELRDGLYLWTIDESAFADVLSASRGADGMYGLASLRERAIAKLDAPDESTEMYVDLIGYPDWDPEVRKELIEANDPAEFLDVFCALLCAEAIHWLPYPGDTNDLLSVIERAEGTFGGARRRLVGSPFKELVRACAGDQLVAQFQRSGTVGLGGWVSAGDIAACREQILVDRQEWDSLDRGVRDLGAGLTTRQATLRYGGALDAYAEVLGFAAECGLGLRTVLLM